jgi:hypothetical protein
VRGRGQREAAGNPQDKGNVAYDCRQ